jgi:hypothetical protein
MINLATGMIEGTMPARPRGQKRPADKSWRQKTGEEVTTMMSAKTQRAGRGGHQSVVQMFV